MLLPLSAFAATGSALTFVQNHQLWDTGPDILQLQEWLNANGYTLAQSGSGSPGNETTTFGLHTYHALLAFQAAHGLPQTGYLGPLTRAAINSVDASGAGASTGSSVSTTTNPPTSSSAAPSAATTTPSYIPGVTPLPGYAPGQITFGGGSSTPAPTPDTTPPSVSLTAPSIGATVSGSSVTLTATASDNVAVANVQFKVDGTNIGSADNSSPYGVTWNSTGVADGSHTGRSRSFLAAEAISSYLDTNELQVAGITKALASLDRGKGIAHARVSEWVSSWETRKERRSPKRV